MSGGEDGGVDVVMLLEEVRRTEGVEDCAAQLTRAVKDLSCPTDARSCADELYRKESCTDDWKRRTSWRTACKISVDIAVQDAQSYSTTRQGCALRSTRQVKPITVEASRHGLSARS